MSMKLKPDAWVKRKYAPKIKELPKSPLTKKQKSRLSKNCWEKCYKAYRNRMVYSGLMSDFDEQSDLVGEAWIAMLEILNRFDTSKCGEIADYDVPGDKNPKTLEFYFLNYFYGRVNFMACESRTHKKSRNVGGSTNQEIEEYEYNPIDESSYATHNSELSGVIMNELQLKPKSFQRFFYQSYILQCSYKELVDEYGQDECKDKKEELQDFVEILKKKYKSEFGSTYKKKERVRKKKTTVDAELSKSVVKVDDEA